MKQELTMLAAALCLCVAFGANRSLAQKVGVTDIEAAEEGTTIQISKGKPGSAPSTEKEFEIIKEQADIAGEPNVLSKGARESWKTACKDWKKEIKDLNKDNQVISLNCGTPKCDTQRDGTVCNSQGNYQLKVKVRK